jgi:hypothetical protein
VLRPRSTSRKGFKLVSSPPLSGLFRRLLARDGRARDLSTGFLEQVDPREGERLDVVALVVRRSRVRQSPASIHLAALRLRTHSVGELCVLPRAVRRAWRLRCYYRTEALARLAETPNLQVCARRGCSNVRVPEA